MKLRYLAPTAAFLLAAGLSACGGGDSNDVVVSHDGAGVTIPTDDQKISITHSDGRRETAPVSDIVDDVPAATVTQFCDAYDAAAEKHGGSLSLLQLTQISVGFSRRYDMTGDDALTLVTELRSRCN